MSDSVTPKHFQHIWKYHPTKGAKLIKSEHELKSLEPEWQDSRTFTEKKAHGKHEHKSAEATISAEAEFDGSEDAPAEVAPVKRGRAGKA